MCREKKGGTGAGRRNADRSPCKAYLEKFAPGQAVAKIARAGQLQVPAQPYELRDQHQHRDAAGDAVECPTREGRRQFIGWKAKQRADQSCEQNGTDEPCEGAHYSGANCEWTRRLARPRRRSLRCPPLNAPPTEILPRRRTARNTLLPSACRERIA